MSDSILFKVSVAMVLVGIALVLMATFCNAIGALIEALIILQGV
jgi:hypothetical protein